VKAVVEALAVVEELLPEVRVVVTLLGIVVATTEVVSVELLGEPVAVTVTTGLLLEAVVALVVVA